MPSDLLSNKGQNSPVQVVLDREVGTITINYPPVNALGKAVRQGLVEAVESLERDKCCKVIVIQCIGRTFIAGADIREFGSPATEPYLPDVVNRIESCSKPVVASMFGTTLGGGLEVALACHYRLSLSKFNGTDCKVGLPEVNLGLIPGAGGTQRLMRLIGIEEALQMITSGKHVTVSSLQDSGLFDAIFASSSDSPLVELQQMTQTFCQQLIANEQLKPKPVGLRTVNAENIDWEQLEKSIIKKARGRIAPSVAFNIIKQTWDRTVNEGMALEREQFLILRDSEQSLALRHAFAAEKKAAKLNTSASPLPVDTVGIIGGGTMGAGICTAFLTAGFTIVLIEQTENAAQVAKDRIVSTFSANVKSGRMSQTKSDSCLAALTSTSNKQTLADCQLIIEAVFEDIEVKKTLFQELDTICDESTLFATNTSYLDINAIAAATNRPEQVIGMHFFSPANIMKLLEVVKAEKSSDSSIATAMAVGKKLRKVSVLVEVCFGFAGNRMYSRYGREVQQMLLEGAKVEQIDAAMTQWGMAMGPLSVQDLSGIDIGHNARSSRPFPEYDPGYFRPAAIMVENNRLGRKSKAGFYNYDDNGKAQIAPEVAKLITDKAAKLGIEQRTFDNEEIVKRALFALISEGFQLFSEGIVLRLSDIDVIWLHGYGFPRYRGGPMFQAERLGIDKVQAELKSLQQQFGKEIWPTINL